MYIITLAERGGAQSHVAELLHRFSAKYRLILVTGAEGFLAEHARRHGVPVHLVPDLQRSIHPYYDASAVASCIALMRQVQPDLVHLHSSKAGLIGRLAAQATRIPAIFTAHGWGFQPGVPLRRRIVVWVMERLAAPLARRIICVSDYDYNLALRYGIGDQQRLVVIKNGIFPEAPRAEPDAAEEVRIVMTARFRAPKTQPQVLRAYQLAGISNARLVMIGTGPLLHTSQALAHKLGISNQVDFMGERADIPELLAKAHIFVLLSRHEGLPISILEAMRAGLPVVASRVGGIPELVGQGENGFLVANNDVRSAAGALSTLVYSPQLRAAMGRKGRQRFEDQFTLDRMLTQIETLYHDVTM